MKTHLLTLVTGTLTALTLGVTSSVDDEQQATKVKPATESKAATSDAPEGLRKLSETSDIWLDTKRKAVVVDGQVCLREGQLEMFACPKGTKEHESVVSVN